MGFLIGAVGLGLILLRKTPAYQIMGWSFLATGMVMSMAPYIVAFIK